MPNNKRISDLQKKLKHLEELHLKLGQHLYNIEEEIEMLNAYEDDEQILSNSSNTSFLGSNIENQEQPVKGSPPYKRKEKSTKSKKFDPKKSINLEKLIGENIINKVGIIITVIGLGIGTNYVIENDLISPSLRILLGYVFSFILAGVSYKLRTQFLNYSAVLFGGSMASMYLLTYAAFDFYQLIPQLLAFAILTILTIATVVVSLGYNKEWVSVFGLVGGYAVPFLLGDEDGNTITLFSYVLFLNLGVLLVSISKYWRILLLSAYVFTWLIFLFWFNSTDPNTRDITLSFTFSTVYFLLFYAAFLISKIRNQTTLLRIDISTLLSNTFIYFGVGFATLSIAHDDYRGLFTIILAGIHFIVGKIVKRFEEPPRTTLSFINGLVLVFITLAIPIQFSDKWITIAWSLEAVLLLWMGRSKKIYVYEVLAYPTILLAISSFIVYSFWYRMLLEEIGAKPFFNQLFLTSSIFLLAMSSVQYILADKVGITTIQNKSNAWVELSKSLVPVAIIITLYISLFKEIERCVEYWQYVSSDGTYNRAFYLFKTLALICYSITFLYIGKRINDKWFKNDVIYRSIHIFSFIVFVFFFISFFDSIKSLRHLYLGLIESNSDQGVFNILSRYILIGFGLLNLKLIYDLQPHQQTERIPPHYLQLFTVFFILFLASSELIQWMDIAGFDDSYKLGLSILWGSFSLGLVFYGILKSNQLLRVASLFLFGVTLVKLFFYDITHLSTISKTVVFMILGILLLAISFIYNKYRDQIISDN